MKNSAAGRSDETRAAWRLCAVRLLSGVLCAVGLTFIVLLVLAAVLFFGNIGEGIVTPIATVLALLVLFFAAKLTARGLVGSGLAFGAAVGILYYVFWYILSYFLFAQFSFSVRTAIFMLIGILTGGIGGVAGQYTPEKAVKKRKKKK